MAGLTTSISASQQFKAVAYLRWCLFRNGFRRKGGRGELLARFVVYPIALVMLLGPVTAALALSYESASKHNLDMMVLIFWGIFVLQLLVSINISPPGLSFDPESLIRFPVTFPRYLSIRVVLGLLSASTIAGTASLFAAAIGVTIADHELGPIAFAAACTLALSNMIFNRMLFAWVDRWLSTRRAREFFTFFIVACSLGVQYLNVTFNGFGHHVTHRDQQAKIQSAIGFYHRVQPILAALPPGQAASAILNSNQGSNLAATFNLFGVLISATIFFVIFAWRMQREYRGENLSEVNHSATVKTAAAAIAPVARPAVTLAPASPAPRNGFLSPEILAAMQKEWIYLRRNPSQLYGLIIPLAMVFLFTARASTFGQNRWIFPGAVAYALMGISALAYNSLGLDASGIQFYFLAPVAMRTIFLAKNLLGFSINILQIILIYALLCFTAGAPGLTITLTTICWAIFSALVNITFANMRSITTPKRIDPSKMSRRQNSQLSALISVALTLTAGAIGFGVFVLGLITGLSWLPIPILLVLDVAAFALYVASLSKLDAMVQNNRETILEELTKVAV